MKKPNILSLGLSLMMTTALVSGVAYAQDEQEGLEEIVVTAERSSERLQNVPLAVTAITSQALDSSGVDSTMDLPSVVPGLVLTTNQTGMQPYLRGIGGVGSSVGVEGSVATYVDGVYISSLSAAAMGFNNIERIEVLRGPQGTLFGRNTTGGLIHVITRDPGNEFELQTGVAYGNYETAQMRLYMAGPITDNLSADIAFFGIDQGEGFGEIVNTSPSAPNPNLGTEVNFRSEWAVRSKWVLDISDDTTLRLILDHGDNRSDLGIVRRELIGTLQSGGRTTQGGPWDTGSGQVPVARTVQSGASVQLDHRFGDLNFSSITAYRYSELDNVLDQDSGPIRFFTGIQHEENETFQQEFILRSDGERFDWTVGAFYFWQDGRQDPQHRTSDTTTAVNFNHYSTQEVEAVSAFAQATVNLTDATSLTLGARFTSEEHTASGRQVTDSPPNPTSVTTIFPERSVRHEEPTYRVVLDHRFTDDLMAYVSYDRGFKSGGYNNSGLNDPPTEPEILTAYQAGIKSEWFDRRLRVNVAGYIYQYENIQLQSIPFGTSVLFNAAEAESHGVELELAALPDVAFGRLELGTTIAYQQGEYVDFPAGVGTTPNPAGGNFVYNADFSGNTMVRLPEWTISNTINYEWPILGGEASANLVWTYNSGFFFEADNRVDQDAFNMVNGELAYAPDGAHWRVRLFGANLLDEVVIQQISAGTVGDQSSYAPPRTYGIGVDWRF